MTRRMLIDAAHGEETRVVVMDGNRVVDYDAEVANKRPLKGNIYLAKVTRVEPSLQAAFVEYGGNRHGFLAFNEIHPDYYKIPIEDREKLIAEEAEAQSAEEGENGEAVETVGGDELEIVERSRVSLQRRYKIQEVVKRRQILLVQVVKEERGTKGAALTTYLSLPGRYCVLMPNTSRGGGISRKITNARDRKRLKGVIEGLGIAEGMAVILRTAGSERSKVEIKRDYDYSMRLWNEIRELTLASTAPALIYEEGNLIKRTIRDLYAKEIQEILVDGEAGYKVAKEFMKALIPSHAKKVKKFDIEGEPLFQKYGAETLLESIHNPTVQLRSGGYIVIHQTEALVAIDVNSGRATRERHIEETALKTNSEAADEIAYQLRLRDLAGLIVIDFIDMEENRNNSAVERRFKDGLRNDRARIQIGRISPFGLLEMSRQRLRPSLSETTGDPCPHCDGTGFMQSTDWMALQVMRAIENEATRQNATQIELKVSSEVALYLLNQKRQTLSELEERNNLRVIVRTNGENRGGTWEIEVLERSGGGDEKLAARSRPANDEEKNEDGSKRRRRGRRRRGRSDEVEASTETEEETTEVSVITNQEINENTEDSDEEGERVRRRRRRGRRGGRRRNRSAEEQAEGTEASASDENAENGEQTSDNSDDSAAAAVPEVAHDNNTDAVEAAGEEAQPGVSEPEDKPKPRRARRPRRRKTVDAEATNTAAAESATVETAAESKSASESANEVAPVIESASAEAPPTESTEKVEPETTEIPVTEEAAPKIVAAEVNVKEEAKPEPTNGPGNGSEQSSETNETAKENEAEAEASPPSPPRRGWWQRVVS
ncbi:MAG: Rne/Rng family ribonuclease [Alphaproteobacteria bacterium]